MKVCPRCGKRYPSGEYQCLEDGTTLAHLSEDPYIGFKLGKYILEEKIGRGGFGLVYRARHSELGTAWAIKILRKQFISDEQLVKRFQREAKVASQIESENVVKIVDTGYDDYLGFYYIMEYLNGRSLSEVMRFYPTGMPLERLLPILEQICSALDAAHRINIVHRDLKPSNIILIERGTQKDFVKILDFGIAKVLQENEGLTATGQIVGSPRFMSPEQAQGLHDQVDPRSDIYSLGVILFWMLTGRLPFESKQLARLLFMHIKTPPPRLKSVRTAPHFSPQLEGVVASALAKTKDERPSSALELYRRVAEACAPFLSNELQRVYTQETSIYPPPSVGTPGSTITDTPSSISISNNFSSIGDNSDSSLEEDQTRIDYGESYQNNSERLSEIEREAVHLPPKTEVQYQNPFLVGEEKSGQIPQALPPDSNASEPSYKEVIVVDRNDAAVAGEDLQETIVTPEGLNKSIFREYEENSAQNYELNGLSGGKFAKTIPDKRMSGRSGDKRKNFRLIISILLLILLAEIVYILIKFLM